MKLNRAKTYAIEMVKGIRPSTVVTDPIAELHRLSLGPEPLIPDLSWTDRVEERGDWLLGDDCQLESSRGWLPEAARLLAEAPMIGSAGSRPGLFGVVWGISGSSMSNQAPRRRAPRRLKSFLGTAAHSMSRGNKRDGPTCNEANRTYWRPDSRTISTQWRVESGGGTDVKRRSTVCQWKLSRCSFS